jgi:hypothetical protein
MSGFNWYAHYEPTDMHIPCCHNPLLSVAKLLLQKLSVWERERERERERVLCFQCCAVELWQSRADLMSELSCPSSLSASSFDPLMNWRWSAQDVEEFQVLAQLVCSFCSFLLQHVLLMTRAVGLEWFLCFCYYLDHQYVICCNSWIQVSVPDHRSTSCYSGSLNIQLIMHGSQVIRILSRCNVSYAGQVMRDRSFIL